MTELSRKIAGLPDDIWADIEKVRAILLRYGAWKIILYGSLARGKHRKDSDIDLCFEGIADEKYFRVVAECLMTVSRPVSLLNLPDVQGYFRERILQEGKVLYEREPLTGRGGIRPGESG